MPVRGLQSGLNAIPSGLGTVALELQDNTLHIQVLTMDDTQPVIDEIARLEDHILPSSQRPKNRTAIRDSPAV